MMGLLGDRDRNLKALEAAFPTVQIVARGNEIRFSGEPAAVERAHTAAEELMLILQQGQDIDEPQVRRVIAMVQAEVPSPSDVLSDTVPVGRGKLVRPKTLGQKRYIDAIRENTLVFGLGPAGTGKTYLAMAAAVEALTSGATRRIILTRPAVEAGERLGFLPGDLEAKINPYLRPLYDALYDMLGSDEVRRLMERGDIEIAPLAYMRGRTLNDACVILDEAQNTTRQQMKMFLTRLGFNSKMIITGDTTQVDLPTGSGSGLLHAAGILDGIPDIGVVRLTADDVVRHRIVAAVIDAYEKADEPASGPGSAKKKRR
jgi:phosphate starvation-inducible PhoH-like protein